MPKEKVSIVLPAYNEEQYIIKAVESLSNQTYKNIEIICVNDGSTDKTLEILNKCSKNDNRIKIIDKKNEGVYKARIDGIEQASGKFLAFCDSDDYYELDAIEKLVNTFNNNSVDLVVANRFLVSYVTKKKGMNRIFFNKTGSIYSYKENSLNGEFNNIGIIKNLFACLYSKLFLTQIMKKSNKKNIKAKVFEDFLLLYSYLENSNKAVIIDDYLYNYNILNVNSKMNSINQEFIDDTIYTLRQFVKLSKDNPNREAVFNDFFHIVNQTKRRLSTIKDVTLFLKGVQNILLDKERFKNINKNIVIKPYLDCFEDILNNNFTQTFLTDKERASLDKIKMDNLNLQSKKDKCKILNMKNTIVSLRKKEEELNIIKNSRSFKFFEIIQKIKGTKNSEKK